MPVITYKALLNGQLTEGESQYPVLNPATEEQVGLAPEITVPELEQAVEAANEAFAAWSSLSSQNRRDYLLQLKATVEANADELAVLITREQGKPLSESSNEVLRCAALMDVLTSLEIPVDKYVDDDEVVAYGNYRPLGVVAAIAAWNYPMLFATIKMVSALYAGNTMVLKPSPFAPLTALRLGELSRGVLPEGVFNVVTGQSDELGRVLTAHPLVKAVTFTGSVPVGKKIMSAGGDSLKRLVLELGGNDAAIVLPDADIEATAREVVTNAYFNSGQVCIAIKRLYVDRAIIDEFSDALVKAMREMVVGDGLDATTTMGPVQNPQQLESMQGFLRDALESGARVVYQSPTPEGKGYYFPATLITDLDANARILREEAFGPILPLVPFDNLDEAIAAANSTDCGLAGSVWTQDLDFGAEVAAQLRCGTAWVNQHRALHPLVPFGGVKDSGMGSELGLEGILALTERRVVNIRKNL